MKLSKRMQFLVKNGLKGMAWLLLILAAYFLFKEVVLSRTPDAWVDQIYARPLLVYLVYCFSEFFFGIFPPELFMIWAINKDTIPHYFMNLTFFAVVSYTMGYLTFLIGRYFNTHASLKYFKKNMLKEVWPQLKKYGLFLIIVAALTPVPWSAVCLLVGSAGYPSKRFLKYALFRLLRFAIYGYIIYQTHVF
ncbi:hypothetical protein OU798_07000 [Prolixibacteraceae bacterium Z1-6]|uniref:Short-chain dehydrogenase n=1 Tax=Draconibacterium aestuarii TaxID=2998507 RepID=A0A9X3FCI6_9BACT|nr:hypothetical protein [Prolixibacteraceae bacterium Z1-6]